MKIIDQLTIMIVPEKSITQATIAEARYRFQMEYGRRPAEIHLNGKAINDMFVEMGQQYIPDHFTLQTVQGLLIRAGAEQYEWYVSSSNETIRELEDK